MSTQVRNSDVPVAVVPLEQGDDRMSSRLGEDTSVVGSANPYGGWHWGRSHIG